MAINPSGMNFTSGLQFGGEMPGGSPGNYNFGNTMNTNPTMTGSNPYSVDSFNLMPSHVTSWGGGMPTMSQNPAGGNGWNTLGLPTSGKGSEWDFAKDLAGTFGKGAGSAVFQYLMQGAGFNSPLAQQAIQAQDVAMNREAQQGWGNIASILGQSGINPNSSVEALSLSNYWGDVTSKENALAAQEFYNMWNQSQSNTTSLLESILNPSKEHAANKGGLLNTLIGTGVGLAGMAFGI